MMAGAGENSVNDKDNTSCKSDQSKEQSKTVLKLPKHLPENASDFRIFVYEVTESKAFSGAILFVILFNTVILVAQTSEDLYRRGGKYRAREPFDDEVMLVSVRLPSISHNITQVRNAFSN